MPVRRDLGLRLHVPEADPASRAGGESRPVGREIHGGGTTGQGRGAGLRRHVPQPDAVLPPGREDRAVKREGQRADRLRMPWERGHDPVALQIKELHLAAGGSRGQGRAIGRQGHRPDAAGQGSRRACPGLKVPQLHPLCRPGGQRAAACEGHGMGLFAELEGGQMLPGQFPQVEASGGPVSVLVHHGDQDRMHLGVGKVRETPGSARGDHAIVIDFDDGLCFSHHGAACLQFHPTDPGIVRPPRGDSQAHLLKPLGIAEPEPNGDTLRALRIGSAREECDGRRLDPLDANVGIEVWMSSQDSGAAR